MTEDQSRDKTTAKPKGDIERTLEYWRGLSAIGKTFWLVGAITSASSLATISENTIKWKGFLADAVEFYKQITDPIRVFISETFDVNATEESIHLFLISAILCSALIRTLIYNIKLAIGNSSILFALGLLPIFSGLIVSTIIKSSAILWIFVFLFIGLPSVYSGMVLIKNGWNGLPAHLTVFWSYLGAILLLFGIAAGINAGLSAP